MSDLKFSSCNNDTRTIKFFKQDLVEMTSLVSFHQKDYVNKVFTNNKNSENLLSISRLSNFTNSNEEEYLQDMKLQFQKTTKEKLASNESKSIIKEFQNSSILALKKNNKYKTNTRNNSLEKNNIYSPVLNLTHSPIRYLGSTEIVKTSKDVKENKNFELSLVEEESSSDSSSSSDNFNYKNLNLNNKISNKSYIKQTNYTNSSIISRKNEIDLNLLLNNSLLNHLNYTPLNKNTSTKNLLYNYNFFKPNYLYSSSLELKSFNKDFKDNYPKNDYMFSFLNDNKSCCFNNSITNNSIREKDKLSISITNDFILNKNESASSQLKLDNANNNPDIKFDYFFNNYSFKYNSHNGFLKNIDYSINLCQNKNQDKIYIKDFINKKRNITVFNENKKEEVIEDNQLSKTQKKKNIAQINSKILEHFENINKQNPNEQYLNIDTRKSETNNNSDYENNQDSIPAPALLTFPAPKKSILKIKTQIESENKILDPQDNDLTFKSKYAEVNKNNKGSRKNINWNKEQLSREKIFLFTDEPNCPEISKNELDIIQEFVQKIKQTQ